MRGIITPMITPAKNGQLDLVGFLNLIEFLKKINVEGFFPASSTGAFPFLNFEEHKKILKLTRENTNENKFVLAGISRNNIKETIEIGKFAIEIGVEGVILVTPYYNKFSQESIYNYYSIIAESLDIPILVYNIPQLTGNDIFVNTLKKLMENYSNIIGIKDSSGDLIKFSKYFIELPKNTLIFQGQDDLLLESLEMGASGGICGTSNFSNLTHELYLNRDLNIHFKIVKLMDFLRKFEFPVSFNYIFRRHILKDMNTKGYSLWPMSDLDKRDEIEISSFVEIELKGK
jgi:dihydrodipicolinate synthase/N-acetylneuraminate lyase